MKKTIMILIFLILNSLLVLPQSSTSSWSSQNTIKDDECTIMVNDGNSSLSIKYKGEIKFTDDEREIESLSRGGYIKYNKDGSKIFVEENGDGRIIYQLNSKDKKYDLSLEDKTLLAKIIKELIAHGVGAKERALRIYNQKGSTGIVKEIELLKGDYVKGIYFEAILNNKNLSQDEFKKILLSIGTSLESDFEKGKLLQAISSDQLTELQTTEIFFNAVKSIDSDFEKANVIKSFVKNQLTADQFAQALDATKTIESDFEKSNVLKKILIESKSIERFEQTLTVVNSIESDFEKAGVLKQLIEKGSFSDDNFNQLISSVGSISSDFEKSNVYRKVLVKGINSDSQWIELLKGIEKIDSDFEKGNLLIIAIERMPDSEKVKAAFASAVKTIDSDFEYGHVMKAIR